MLAKALETSQEESFSYSYAQVYDLLHQEKNYTQETDFVLNLAQECMGRKPKNVIDLACGTGKHLLEFAKQNIYVHGNDISAGMLSQTEHRLKKSFITHYALTQEPMQSLKIDHASGKGFDLATAFYTAVGYLYRPGELEGFLENLKDLLKTGGIFFMDAWNGERMAKGFSPSRTKKASDATLSVERTSNVSAVPQFNALKVDFQFKIQDKKTSKTSTLKEEHIVRYHTLPELLKVFKAHDFEVLAYGPFLEDAKNWNEAWNFYVLARNL